MHFDDRLATVLRHRAAGERAARTQFRQLLDMLGGPVAKRDGQRDESLMAAAWLRLGALGETIPLADRARILREPGMRFRNPELVAHLAEDEPDVAAAALANAELSADDWEALIPRLPVRARGFLRLRRDLPPDTKDLLERLGVHDRGLPEPVPATDVESPAKEKSDAPVAANDLNGDDPESAERGSHVPENSAIGVLVKRIEAFRKSRSEHTPEAPRLPLDDQADDAEPVAPQGFSFTADATGRINWAENRLAPMVIGTSLTGTSVKALVLNHQPIRGEIVTLEGGPAIAGEWIIDAAPRFTSPDGRFYGYAGTARRPVASETPPKSADSSEADRLRQLLHELRTPVNAIQGFSEVIQQQLFGPTPHDYRALAASIAGDSARMLAGFDELDRLAKLETGALELDAGEADFAAIVERMLGQLEDVLRPRTASIELSSYGSGTVPISQFEAETIAWRLLATLASRIGAGEHLQIELTNKDGTLVISCELPVNLAAKGDLFAPSSTISGSTLNAGMFGAGFSMRLLKAEAAATGGSLERMDDWLQLTLPLLTGHSAEPSHETVS